MSEAEPRCSFCHKAQSEVTKLIVAADANICDWCVEICRDIISDDNRFRTRPDFDPASRPTKEQLREQFAAIRRANEGEG